MTNYYAVVRQLEGRFEGLELTHVPRVENEADDASVKLGSTRKPISLSIFLEHLHEPTIHESPCGNPDNAQQPKLASAPKAVQIPIVIDLNQEI